MSTDAPKSTSTRKPVPVALSTSCLFPLGVPETFSTAVDLGYDSVEVMITHQRPPRSARLVPGPAPDLLG